MCEREIVLDIIVWLIIHPRLQELYCFNRRKVQRWWVVAKTKCATPEMITKTRKYTGRSYRKGKNVISLSKKALLDNHTDFNHLTALLFNT